ncbi:hypothetical protein [Saccharopolyspora dendranthemae]|nr:hypothetical protein [Saccharopolyspora dendranthemae]
MPKPYPQEFRDDVVAVARRREASLTQVASDAPSQVGLHDLAGGGCGQHV